MNPREFEELLSDAEVQLTRLRHLYDQWFQGLERTEPIIARKKFDRTLNVLRKNLPRRTVFRFKFQQLVQRYTSMQTYWRRIGRQIEEGTYRRDLLRARRRRGAARAQRRSSRAPVADQTLNPNADMDIDKIINEASASVDRLASKANKPIADRRKTGDFVAKKNAPPPIPPRSKGPGDLRVRQLYEAYIAAKHANNESVDKVSYESVAKSIKKAVPQLERKHKGRGVDFEVVTKNGKVGLKPVIKK